MVAAGNVMILLAPGTESAVLANIARHLRSGGLLIAGFQLRPEHMTLSDYDRIADRVGFALAERYATWDRDPWGPESGYAVSVHRLLGRASEPS